MQTLTMQGVAELASVSRAVVSVWRRRAAGTAQPFPSPIASQGEAAGRRGAGLRFDAQAVGEWLHETGRGNNGDAHLEAALYSSRFDSLLADVDAASALLALYDVLGGPLADVDVDAAISYLSSTEQGSEMSADAAAALLGDAELVSLVDELAEAAFSGRRVLDRLVTSFTRPDAPWADEALTSVGEQLMAEAITTLLTSTPRRIVPTGPGGYTLAGTIATGEDGTTGGKVVLAHTSRSISAEERAARRRLLARGAQIASDEAFETEGLLGDLVLYARQSSQEPQQLFDDIENVVLDLAPTDAAIILGPAELLVDELRDPSVRAARLRLLTGEGRYTAPLRYVARLPKGLSRFGGRRRLALWVLGEAAPHADVKWTVYGEHADTRMTGAHREALAADIAAALTGGDALTAHAFLSSTRLATSAFVRRPQLVIAPFAAATHSGAESLARIWELDHGVLDGLPELVSTETSSIVPSPGDVSWQTAVPGLARELRGARLPAESIGVPAPARAGIIGPAEVRDSGAIGQRTIGRLDLAASVPRAVLTQPGDVVFTTEGGTRAMIDAEGGHVLEAPARALRCKAGQPGERRLHPTLLARDIAAQTGRDRRTWRLRTVAADAYDVLDRAATAISARRVALEQDLRELDALDDELTTAIAAGTLTATDRPQPPHPSKENR